MLVQKCRAVLYHPKTQCVIRFFVHFLQNVSFHGLSHLARRDIHFMEFLFWICSIVSMVSFAFQCSISLSNDYTNSESILIIRKNHLTFETALPAFTFCPHQFFDQRKAQQFLENKSIPLDERSKILRLFEKLGKRSISSDALFEEHDFAHWIKHINYLELFFNFSIQHEITSQNGDRGVRIFTEFGICYTFNNLLIDAIKTENWGDRTQANFIQNLSQKTYSPTKVSFRDSYPMNITFQIPNTSASFDFYIHSPYEIPTIWTRKAVVINAWSVKKWFIPLKIIEVANDKRNHKCRNMNHSNLEMFPTIYTQNLCLIECRAKYAIKLCDCIPHFYAVKRIIRQFPNTPICTTTGLNCLTLYGPILAKMHGNSKLPFRCNCLPNCGVLSVWSKLTKVIASQKHNEVICYLPQAPSMFFKRSQIFSAVDLAVSIGNFLSVFFGFNLLCVAEVIYFFTLRLFWYRRGYLGDMQ